MKNPLPDSPTLLMLLRYDEESGRLYWRRRMSQRIKADDPAGHHAVAAQEAFGEFARAA